MSMKESKKKRSLEDLRSAANQTDSSRASANYREGETAPESSLRANSQDRARSRKGPISSADFAIDSLKRNGHRAAQLKLLLSHSLSDASLLPKPKSMRAGPAIRQKKDSIDIFQSRVQQNKEINDSSKKEEQSSSQPAGGRDTDSTAADNEWSRMVGLALLGGAQTPGHGDKTPAVDPTVGPIPAPDVKPEEVSKTDPRLQSFLDRPSEFSILKKADASFESYQESVSADHSNKKETNNSQSKGEDDGDEKARSAYSRGIIDLLKSGYKSAMQLKEKYEEYQAVKEEKEASPNKIREFKAAFESSISGTTQALTLINGYQKGADNLVQAAIPFYSVVVGAVSLISRIVALIKQGNLDLGNTAEASQTENILSSVVGDDSKKKEITQVLKSKGFRNLLITTAEFRQQQRDNPEIFSEYQRAKGNNELQKRLKKRYPRNYSRIEEIEKKNALDINAIGAETDRLLQLGVSREMIDVLIDDQTLINHLQEVKSKRSRNAKIGIFTDLVNLGADIATLSGSGAVAGAAMRAGTAAIGIARAGGNSIKFSARNSGAKNFSDGAKSGLFGSSVYDVSDILKSDSSKQRRYFATARRLVDNIADHDGRVASQGQSSSEASIASLNKNYGWVETKILGTGASVAVVKAIANQASRDRGNALVGYVIEKMKTR